MLKYAWNPDLYNNTHSFIPRHGEAVVDLLAPQSGETILDLGCGTGILTQKIADSGANTIGIDISEAMLAEAKQSFPKIEFKLADAHSLNLGIRFDAIFSNAALHWMLEPSKVLQSVWNALKPQGRFVFEMGGRGNTETIELACEHAIEQLGLIKPSRINHFPSVAEFSKLLENQGFLVTYAIYFERPTVLSGNDGLRSWIKMLRNNFLVLLAPSQYEQFFMLAEEYARPKLFNSNNEWVADYVRLRMVAKKI